MNLPLLPTSEQVLAWLLDKGLTLVIILVASLIIYQVAVFFINKAVILGAREKAELTPKLLARRKRAQTLGALLRNVLKYVIFFFALVTAISEVVGRNVATPLIASAGVVGLAIGFGAQSLIKDIASGFFILFEGQYAVGEFVSIKAGPYEATGIVDEFGLRMTTLRDIDGNLHYVPNGQIVGVDKFAHGYVTYNVEAILPATESSRAARAAIDIAADIGAHQPFLLSPPVAQVVEGFAGESIVRLRLNVVPSQAWVADAVGERLAKCLKEELGLESEPPATKYTINEDMAESYGDTILVRSG